MISNPLMEIGLRKMMTYKKFDTRKDLIYDKFCYEPFND